MKHNNGDTWILIDTRNAFKMCFNETHKTWSMFGLYTLKDDYTTNCQLIASIKKSAMMSMLDLLIGSV